jgi:hypothetical protein
MDKACAAQTQSPTPVLVYLNGKDKKGQANYDSHQRKSTCVKVIYTTFLNMYINLAVGMVLLDIIVFPQRRNQSK